MSGIPGAAFLQAPGSTNDHDLGLFEIGADAGPSGAGRTTVGLTPGLEVDTLDELDGCGPPWTRPAPGRVERPRHHQEPVRQGSGRAGVRGRLIIPADLLDDEARAARVRIGRLDLAGEGAVRRPDPGGVGISVPHPDPGG